MYHVTELVFEWDKSKESSNRLKHGVTFEEARGAFFDAFAQVIPDPLHSKDEDRFILLGISRSLRLLVVVHALRNEGNTIRIISARKATTNETVRYRRGRRDG